MIKKVFSALGIMLVATACQPQADNQNSMNRSSDRMYGSESDRQERMYDGAKGSKNSMNQSGRSQTRARMNERGAPPPPPPRGAPPPPPREADQGDGCDYCDTCGPCCDTCGPCCE